MILHLALFTFHDGTSETDVAELTDALTAMAAELRENLVSYQCGPSLGLTPGGADYAVSARVASPEDLRAYLDSPEHQAVYDRVLGRLLASRSVAQLEVPA
jgi:hypothetical protein